MNRISLLAVVTSTCLLGVLAIGSTTASATVLCKKETVSHYCGPENVYLKGTKVQAELAPGTKSVLSLLGGENYSSCSSSKLEMTTESAGGLEVTDLQAALDEFSFAGCDRLMEPYPSQVGASFAWTPETHTGTVSLFKVFTAQMPAWLSNSTCRYSIAGPGQIVPGATPKIVFGEESFAYQAGTNPFLCPKKLKFKATYNITTPAPLYVEKY